MNKFELFTMIYYALDSYYSDVDEIEDSINVVISGMNPFLWEDISSADPAYYDEFCKFISDKEINLDNSLEIAKEYIKTIKYANVADAMMNMPKDKWLTACKEYLKSEHKGAEASY